MKKVFRLFCWNEYTKMNAVSQSTKLTFWPHLSSNKLLLVHERLSNVTFQWTQLVYELTRGLTLCSISWLKKTSLQAAYSWYFSISTWTSLFSKGFFLNYFVWGIYKVWTVEYIVTLDPLMIDKFSATCLSSYAVSQSKQRSGNY